MGLLASNKGPNLKRSPKATLYWGNEETTIEGPWQAHLNTRRWGENKRSFHCPTPGASLFRHLSTQIYSIKKKPYYQFESSKYKKHKFQKAGELSDYWNLTQLNFGPRILRTNAINPISDFCREPNNSKKKKKKNRKLTIITGTCFCARGRAFFKRHPNTSVQQYD